MLCVENLTVRYGGTAIVDGLSFDVEPGQWLMIAGPNGAGKSTALNAIMQGAEYTGSVRFEGKNLRRMRPGERARCTGALLQHNIVGYAFTVEEIVRLGRYAYRGGPLAGRRGDEDRVVARALEMTGMIEKRNQSVLTLSGGELQRAFLAQVFAQDPRLLILDEPTNHLDLIYQKQVFTLIRDWLKTEGRAVISVVHDLSLARAYGTDAVLMQRGRCVARGGVQEVFCRENLERVYDMDVYAWMQGLLGQWQ